MTIDQKVHMGSLGATTDFFVSQADIFNTFAQYEQSLGDFKRDDDFQVPHNKEVKKNGKVDDEDKALEIAKSESGQNRKRARLN
jgi:hypothetical protein